MVGNVIVENYPDQPPDVSQPPDPTPPRHGVAPIQRSALFRHFIGLALACLAAAWSLDALTFSPLALQVHSLNELIELVLSPSLFEALFVFLLVLGLGDLGNFINTPRNHVAKIYQPFGLRGSQQLIAFSLVERGWKPVMKRQGWGWVPFSIFLDIYYFPWPRVPSDQIGYIISNIGKPLGPGRRTATSLPLDDEKQGEVLHESPYRDVQRFINDGGELGIQRTVITPGFLKEIDPVAFTVITGDENGIYGYLTDPDLRAKQEAGTLNWRDFGNFASIGSPERVARLKAEISTLEAERDKPEVRSERKTAIDVKLVELQRELRETDIFLPTIIEDDEQGLVTILDGPTLRGGQLVHRFGGFEDIKAIIEKNDTFKVAGKNITCYQKHIAASHSIKEALDRKAHLEKDIADREAELAEQGVTEERKKQIDADIAHYTTMRAQGGIQTPHQESIDRVITQLTAERNRKAVTPERKAKIEQELPELRKKLTEFTANVANDADKLIEAFGKKDGFGDFGEREAGEWRTLLNQNYNPIEDIFRTGRKFEMHLSQEILKAALDSTLELHDSFQNLRAYFINNGTQGPQWDTLKPGRFNHNRFVVAVKVVKRVVVPQGQVYVIKSDIGLTGEDITHRRFAFGQIVRPGFRGIWLATLPPGTYRFNTTFLHYIPVPTALVTLFWGKGTKALTLPPDNIALDSELGAVTTITADGYSNIKLNIDAQVVFPAEAAAIIIATFGSVHDLVKGQFSARLSAYTIEIVRTRTLEVLITKQIDVQKAITAELIKLFSPLEIQVRAVLIQEISGADEYLDLRQQQIIAHQQEILFNVEAKVEKARAEQMKNAGEAQQAFELAMAKQDVEIAGETQKAIAKLFQDTAGITGPAIEELRKQLLEGISVHYLKRAVGPEAATMIKVMQYVKESGVDIVSKVQVGGEQGTLLDAIIGGYLGKASSISALDNWVNKSKIEKEAAKKRLEDAERKRRESEAPKPPAETKKEPAGAGS